MKIRVLPGALTRYHLAGGSWSEDTPDEKATDVELSAVPTVGQFVTYILNDEKRVIARVDDVVLVDGSIPHAFVTQAN
jgi:hypothetical protein